VRLEKKSTVHHHPRTGLPNSYENFVCKTLQDQHEHLYEKLFKAAISDPTHKIGKLLPTRNEANYDLRNKRTFNVPRVRTNRLKPLVI
jgi:hypothetical protein